MTEHCNIFLFIIRMNVNFRLMHLAIRLIAASKGNLFLELAAKFGGLSFFCEVGDKGILFMLIF